MPALIRLTGHHLSKYTNIVPLHGAECKLSPCGLELHTYHPVVTSISGKDEGMILPWVDGKLVIPANKLVRMVGGTITVGKYQIIVSANPALAATGIVGGTGILACGTGQQEFGVTLFTIRQTELSYEDSQFFAVVID